MRPCSLHWQHRISSSMSAPSRRPQIWRPLEQADPTDLVVYATSSRHGGLMAPSRRSKLATTDMPLRGRVDRCRPAWLSHGEFRETKWAACICSPGSTNHEPQGKTTPRHPHM
jgi:hypothetical protein